MSRLLKMWLFSLMFPLRSAAAAGMASHTARIDYLISPRNFRNWLTSLISILTDEVFTAMKKKSIDLELLPLSCLSLALIPKSRIQVTVIFPTGQSLVRMEMKKIVVKKEECEGTLKMTFRFKSLGQLINEDDPAPLSRKGADRRGRRCNFRASR